MWRDSRAHVNLLINARPHQCNGDTAQRPWTLSGELKLLLSGTDAGNSLQKPRMPLKAIVYFKLYNLSTGNECIPFQNDSLCHVGTRLLHISKHQALHFILKWFIYAAVLWHLHSTWTWLTECWKLLKANPSTGKSLWEAEFLRNWFNHFWNTELQREVNQKSSDLLVSEERDLKKWMWVFDCVENTMYTSIRQMMFQREQHLHPPEWWSHEEIRCCLKLEDKVSW